MNKRITLDLKGLHCAACANAIERAVGSLPGVVSSSVNLAASTGTFIFDETSVSADDIVKKIRGAGYDVAEPSTELTLPIAGMHCAACAAAVEEALAGVPGVARASVNLAAETAAVKYDPGKADVTALRQAVARAGYTVPETGEEKIERPWGRKSERQLESPLGGRKEGYKNDINLKHRFVQDHDSFLNHERPRYVYFCIYQIIRYCGWSDHRGDTPLIIHKINRHSVKIIVV